MQNIFQLGVKPARSRGGGKGKSIKTRNGGKNTDVDPYRPDGMPEPGPPEDAHISAAKKKNWEHMKGECDCFGIALCRGVKRPYVCGGYFGAHPIDYPSVVQNVYGVRDVFVSKAL